MPTYTITAPDGNSYSINGPEGATREDVVRAILAKNPTAGQPPSTERTTGEAFKDVGAGVVSGVGSVVQLPGQLYGLATGDFSKTGALGLGQDIQKYGEEMKSAGLKAREAARTAKVQEAEKEGQFAAFKAALGETITDPALLTSFLAEQVPQLIPMILAGGGAGYIAKQGVMSAAAARGAAQEAAKRLASKKAVQAGTTAAIQTGAVMQGADVGAGSYDEIYGELRKQGMSEEQAAAETINKARAAGVAGYGLSVLANRYLPGGKALEEILAGKKIVGGRIGTGVVTGLKEIPSENIEEVGGRVAQNIAAQQAGLDRELLAGTGETAAMATIGAAGVGGGAGLLAGRAPTRDIPPSVDQKTDTTQQQDQTTDTIQEQESTITSLADVFADKPTPKTSPDIEALVADYNKREAEIKEMEARGVSLTNQERNLLNGKRQKQKKLKAQIDALIQTPPAGEQDVTKPDTESSGVGATVSAPAADKLSTAAGTESSERDGMVSTGPDATVSATGEKPTAPAVTPPTAPAVTPPTAPAVTPPTAPAITPPTAPTITQPTEITSGTQASQTVKTKPEEPQATPAAVTATTRKTKLDADEAFLNSLLGDDGLPSRGSAAATPEQAKIDARVDSMAADYGLVRIDGESTQQLANRLKLAAAERRAAEQEFVRRTTEEGEPLAAIEDQLVSQQSLISKKPITVPVEQREMYEEMREGFNQGVEDETQKLPEFDNLTPDEKTKYFQENISRNSWDEHGRAAESLSDYIESKRTESEEATRRATKRGVSQKASEPQRREAQDLVRAGDSYQRERLAFSRKAGIAYELPNWGSLSKESQRAYASINKTDTVLEQDMGFRAVKKQVQKEQETERSRLGIEEAERRSTQEMEAAAERARGSQPAGKGGILPLNVIKMLGRGNIAGVLDYLNKNGQGLKPKTARVLGQGRVKIRDTIAQKVFRALAGALANVEGLKVNVVFDKNMVYDQLARYDANTNTLYVGPKGLDEATILHELLHAATVKVIHQFFTDKTKLDARQIAAVEQIQTIASYAKRIMGTRFPNAFENLYEFVAYALTDLNFQNELSKAQVPGIARATKKSKEADALAEIAPEAETERNLGRVTEPPLLFESLWDAFTGTLAWMYKLFRPEQQQTKILLPTEKTRVGKRVDSDKKIAPVKDTEQRKMTAEEREALAPETLFDNPEVEANEATIPALPGEMVAERGITNLQRAVLREPGYRGNLLLEVAAAVQQIMEAPEGGITALAGKETVSSELYAKTPAAKQERKKAEDKDNSVDAILESNELPELSTVSNIRKHYGTRKAYNYLKKKFQNSRDAIKRWEDALSRAGKIIYSGKDLNDVYTQIVSSSGRAKDLYMTRVEPSASELRNAVNDYAKATGLTVEKAARNLHVIGMARHEGERRDVKYMLNVPLNKDKQSITLPGGTTLNIAPSEFRIRAMDAIFSGKLNVGQIKELRTALNDVVAKYADPTGFSGINGAEPGGYTSVDRNSTEYNVVGRPPSAMADVIEKLYTSKDAKVKAAVDKAMKAMQGLHKATTELDKESNYWSKPVQSVVDFYGWENYIPLKGKQHFVGKNDDLLSFDSARLGNELQEKQHSFEGRETEADNSILQSMVDATRASLRAGRKDVTLAIKNAVKNTDPKKRLLYGEIKATIPFADRFKAALQEYSGPNYVYHYNADGSVDIILLSDKEQREAIKRTYQESQPLIDALNTVTSTIGQMHTRYNVAFGPMNFVRDALTNAFTIGAEMGPKAAAQYIGAISAKVATGGLFKAGKVAYLYESGNSAEIQRLAAKDPYIAGMYEYIKQGGKVSYLQGISSNSQQKELQRDLGSSSLKKAKAAVDRVVDVWVDSFELASRAAAYEVSKSQFMAQGMSEADAKAKATGYAKNLANFEQVGEWGRAAGAAFVFFRPAATGAVRAIEAVEPWFRGVESAMADLPTSVRNDPEAVKKFKAKYKQQHDAARAMTLGLLGLGAAVYGMAYMLADDDDQGRNKVATDDASRWSRYARFHLNLFDKDIIFQMPWGFGLGAFAAAGAQIASVGLGNTSVKDVLTNTFLIGMDSFLPLPVSRISPMDQPAAWLMDSALPSALRPFLEWTMNVDGLGRQIYNNRQSRFGDAYTGGDNIPEMYKAAARMFYEATNGAVDWSPNTMYFFANNYLDGVTRLGHGTYNIALVGTGNKEFNPKTDTLVFDSFFGAPSNIDAREFSNVENKILDIKKRLNSLADNNPDQYAKYVEKNPMHLALVSSYDQQVNQTLRDLREQANVYRRMQGLTPKERNELVKSTVQMQNLVKRNLLDTFEAYEVKP
jgi:hypothetical protein